MKARHEFKSESAWRHYLRHYYAGEAMSALLVSPNFQTHSKDSLTVMQRIAGASVTLADDLIAALDAEKEQK